MIKSQPWDVSRPGVCKFWDVSLKVGNMSFPISLSCFMELECKGYASSLRMRVMYPVHQPWWDGRMEVTCVADDWEAIIFGLCIYTFI